MSTGREIRCYDYVNHPYAKVREALAKDALAVFQSATRAANSRAEAMASELRVDLGGIAIEADIRITTGEIVESAAGLGPETRIPIEWQSANLPNLFPIMRATLAIYPLTATETQLDFQGAYEPPLGALGAALNAMGGHRVAEVAVHRFVNDVAGYLRGAIG